MFSPTMQRFYLWCRRIREPIVAPVVAVLAKHKVKPDTLSYLGLAMIFPFVYFFSFHPWIAFIFILAQLVLDGIDGPLARATHQNSARGDLLDHSIDYLFFVIVYCTTIYYGLVSGFWGSIHILLYAVMQALVLAAPHYKIASFPIIRSKGLFYGFLFLWLITGQNYFDPFLVAMSVYLAISTFFLWVRFLEMAKNKRH